MNQDHLIEVGVLGRPHGIRGEVRVTYYAESPELLQGEVWLQAGNRPPRRVEVLSSRLHQGSPLVLLAGFTDRTAAETLRGQTVLVPEDSLPEPDEDEMYLYELLGFSVVLDATGEHLGQLDHVLFHGEQETWAIAMPQGGEIYLPAVPEFVANIDSDARCIRITPPEGLLELYRQV